MCRDHPTITIMILDKIPVKWWKNDVKNIRRQETFFEVWFCGMVYNISLTILIGEFWYGVHNSE